MRYVSTPTSRRPAKASDWWDFGPLVPALQAPDSAPVDTGLVDQRGNKILRVPPPIGFGRNEEW